MIYVLAYPRFAPSCAAQIAAFRARHEPQRAKLVPPHITLVFGAADAHLEAIRALVESVSRQTQPFTMSFDAWTSAFDPFEKAHKLFLLCGAGRAAVTALHTRLYDGPHRETLDRAHPFRPHMTIATYDTRAEIDHVEIPFAGDLPFCADLQALELVHLGGGRLTHLKRVPFSQ